MCGLFHVGDNNLRTVHALDDCRTLKRNLIQPNKCTICGRLQIPKCPKSCSEPVEFGPPYRVQRLACRAISSSAELLVVVLTLNRNYSSRSCFGNCDELTVYTGCANKKQSPRKKCYISATVVRIWAKLSDFVCEYSHNTQCKLDQNNWYSSSDSAV